MKKLLTAAVLAVIAVGVLTAFGIQVSCAGPCRTGAVADRFWFLHRDLGEQGSITVRLTGMSGTITHPPPGHDKIVPGLVPWAKAGIIIKADTVPGSPYAALMMTAEHGVRLQHDYRHDIAGRPGRDMPHWLRLTRDGTTITGAESLDGQAWHTVGTVSVPGLPSSAQVGLFATSPGALTVRGGRQQMRFTQAVGVFDSVTVTGTPEPATATTPEQPSPSTASTRAPGSAPEQQPSGTPEQPWRSTPIGEANRSDWERLHHPAGAVVAPDGTITVSGSGDIGPVSEDGGPSATLPLSGLVIVVVAVLVVAYSGYRSAFLHGATAGLAAAGVTLAGGWAVLAFRHIPQAPLSWWTAVRVVLGLALALGLLAVLAHGLRMLLRRRRVAAVVASLLVAVPYAVATTPLLPVEAARWLLRITPAAALAVQQTAVSYPQVPRFEAPWTGFYPLPAWAGLLVLIGWIAAIRAVGRAHERALTAARTDHAICRYR